LQLQNVIQHAQRCALDMVGSFVALRKQQVFILQNILCWCMVGTSDTASNNHHISIDVNFVWIRGEPPMLDT